MFLDFVKIGPKMAILGVRNPFLGPSIAILESWYGSLILDIVMGKRVWRELGRIKVA